MVLPILVSFIILSVFFFDFESVAMHLSAWDSSKEPNQFQSSSDPDSQTLQSTEVEDREKQESKSTNGGYLSASKEFIANHPYVSIGIAALVVTASAAIVYYCFFQQLPPPPTPQPPVELPPPTDGSRVAPYIADYEARFRTYVIDVKQRNWHWIDFHKHCLRYSIRTHPVIPEYFPDSVRRIVPDIHEFYPYLAEYLRKPWKALPYVYSQAILRDPVAPMEWAFCRYQLYVHCLSYHNSLMPMQMPILTFEYWSEINDHIYPCINELRIDDWYRVPNYPIIPPSAFPDYPAMPEYRQFIGDPPLGP